MIFNALVLETEAQDVEECPETTREKIRCWNRNSWDFDLNQLCEMTGTSLRDCLYQEGLSDCPARKDQILFQDVI